MLNQNTFDGAENPLMVCVCSAWRSSVGSQFYTPSREDHFYFEGVARGMITACLVVFPASKARDEFMEDLEYLITLSAFRSGVAV